MTEPKTVTDRLEEMLVMKDERIEALEAELRAARDENRTLEYRIDGAIGGWSLPRTIEDKHPELPVPRLELFWMLGPEWGGSTYSYEVEYRIVRRHLLDHLEVTPLSRTKITGSMRPRPWMNGEEIDLPFRDGAHIAHDSAHLNLPAYAVTPDGATLLDFKNNSSHVTRGLRHRTTP